MDLAKLSRDDLILGGLALFLIIDLLFLPWHSYSYAGFTINVKATSAPEAAWGILALLADIAFLSDLALENFGTPVLPAVGGSRHATRVVLSATTLFFMAIKFLVDPNYLGAGCWLGMIAVIVLFVLCIRHTAA